jgi:hypothetical protein
LYADAPQRPAGAFVCVFAHGAELLFLFFNTLKNKKKHHFNQ